MAGKEKLLCWTCGKSFSRSDSLARHLETHTGVEYACSICDKMFSQKAALKRHKQTKHESILQYQCTTCGKTFTRKDSLTKHEKVHRIGGYKCTSCMKEFSSKEQLDQHLNTHKRSCECGMTFTRDPNLSRHKQHCKHGKGNASVSRSSKKCPITRSTLADFKQCDKCGKQFSRMDNLRRHQLEMHTQAKYRCSFCGMALTRYKLKKHVEICDLKTIDITPHSVKERVNRHRSIEKVKKILPKSPRNKARHVQSLIDTPTGKTRKYLEESGLVQKKKDEDELKLYKAMFQDYTEVDQHLKSKRSDAVRCHRRNASAQFLGTQTKRARKWTKAAKLLSAPHVSRKITKEKVREQLIQGSEAVFTDVMRKSRGEKIPQDWKNKIAQYWTHTVSHPSTDTKRNQIRKRTDTKQYIQHNRHIMTKSYREAYCMFVKQHPDVKISEATFRRLKPFFVRPATARDLEQCCCMSCVSVRKAHRALMNFRQRQKLDLPIFSNVYELVKSTLCPKEKDKNHHNLKCLKQECERCGLQKLKFHEKEISNSDNTKVKWQRFEQVPTKWTTRDGTKKTGTHLELVNKNTPPKELTDHLKVSLTGFPYHLFVASWQRHQWEALIENLPVDHAAIEMDFSENFTTLFQEEVQSLHWAKSQCAIHSCVLWRPSVPDDRTADTHVKEHWLIISEDLNHDHNFVNHNLNHIVIPKLQQMGCEITTLHQRTDGCAAQYKSRHVFGDYK